jgi:hypothetical protein
MFLFSAPGLCDSVTYYGPDHSEITLESYQKSAEDYQKRYKEAKKTWGYVKTDLVRESITLSGMDHFIATFPRNIDMLSQQGTFSSGNTEIDNKAIGIIKNSFDPISARKQLIWYCKKHMNNKMLGDVMPYLRSPVGRKITQAENEALSPEFQAGLLVYAQNLQQNQPPQERVVIIEEFIEAADMVDSAIDIAMELFEGITISMNLASPKENQIDESRIRSLVERIRPTIEKQMEQNIRISTYYTYRNISNEEIMTYIDFLYSESGSQFNKIGTKAITHVLLEYFTKVGKKLVSSTHV